MRFDDKVGFYLNRTSQESLYMSAYDEWTNWESGDCLNACEQPSGIYLSRLLLIG